MNKATRMLAIAGMALAAGATIGASPAMAASSSSSSPTTVAAQAKQGDRIVDFFRSYRVCDAVGDRGEWMNRWEDHTCYRIHYGFRRGWYALSVDYGWNHHWNNNNWHHGDWHHGNGDWHHGNGDWHHGNGNGDGHHGNGDGDGHHGNGDGDGHHGHRN